MKDPVRSNLNILAFHGRKLIYLFILFLKRHNEIVNSLNDLIYTVFSPRFLLMLLYTGKMENLVTRVVSFSNKYEDEELNSKKDRNINAIMRRSIYSYVVQLSTEQYTSHTSRGTYHKYYCHVVVYRRH